MKIIRNSGSNDVFEFQKILVDWIIFITMPCIKVDGVIFILSYLEKSKSNMVISYGPLTPKLLSWSKITKFWSVLTSLLPKLLAWAFPSKRFEGFQTFGTGYLPFRFDLDFRRPLNQIAGSCSRSTFTTRNGPLSGSTFPWEPISERRAPPARLAFSIGCQNTAKLAVHFRLGTWKASTRLAHHFPALGSRTK